MLRYVPSKVKLVLAVLIVLLALSAYLIYFFHDRPITRIRYVANCEYRQQANYNYVASIKPSVLYENRNTLLPGETAYRSLIKSLNISLTYDFISNPSPNHVEITYYTSAVLEAEGQWTKQLISTPEKTENTPGITETYTLNLTETEELIKTIEKETDIRASTYYYKIIPKIHLNSSINGVSITEEYTPTFQIKLAPTILEFTGLSHTELGSIGDHETYETSWSLAGFTTTIRSMRYLSYALILLFSSCLVLTVWRMQKIKPLSFMETIKKEHREKIIEAKEPLNQKIEKTTIKVESVEDLVKASEETFKPIIHETITIKKGKMKRHTLYVLDTDIKYEFVMDEPIEPTKQQIKNSQQKATQTKTQTNGQ